MVYLIPSQKVIKILFYPQGFWVLHLVLLNLARWVKDLNINNLIYKCQGLRKIKQSKNLNRSRGYRGGDERGGGGRRWAGVQAGGQAARWVDRQAGRPIFGYVRFGRDREIEGRDRDTKRLS
jgi:hypothetical protein